MSTTANKNDDCNFKTGPWMVGRIGIRAEKHEGAVVVGITWAVRGGIHFDWKQRLREEPTLEILFSCIFVSQGNQRRGMGLPSKLQNKTPGKTHFVVELKNAHPITSPSLSSPRHIYRSCGSPNSRTTWPICSFNLALFPFPSFSSPCRLSANNNNNSI